MYTAPTLDFFGQLNLGVALPALAVMFGSMIVLLMGLFVPQERRHSVPIAALSLISAGFIMTLFTFNPPDAEAFGGMYRGDAFANMLNLIVLATAFLAILGSTDYLRMTQINHPEYYTLLLLSTSGAMIMAGANDLLLIFIALELLSIPLYVLAAFRTTDGTPTDEVSSKSQESGIKYFILGAFSSAFFVYGAALVYGATGTTNLNAVAEAVQGLAAAGDFGTAGTLLLLGAALILVGLGFKVAAVPFHMWTPDVYEGSPTPVTAFMSVAAKAGGFASLLRIVAVGLAALAVRPEEAAAWQPAFQLVAILTLVLGNVVALAQNNLKRMLAYSSIAHAGYILMAVAAVGSAPLVEGIGDSAAQSILIYLAAYMFTNLGAFAVVSAVEREDGSGVMLDDLNGLFNTRPWLAVAMAIFMLSLTGIPLTAGFIGKYLVINAAVQAGLIALAVVGVLTSVVSAFYYMRVIVNMFLRSEAEGVALPVVGQPLLVAVYASMAGTLVLGILPTLLTGLVNLVQLV
ncbi:NADH-quinone oxidoreductase subunit N [Aggregatilineales bacterium SYSU G02658]